MSNLRTRLLSRAAALLALSLVAFALTADDLARRSVEGTLIVVWGDPRPGASGGETRYALALSDGTLMPLQLNGQEQDALANFGQRVTVSGLVDANATIDVESIAGPGAATQSVLGTKKVIYLLVKFSDDAAVPHPPVFYTDLNNPDTPPAGEVFPTTVNAFFKKTSWNQFSWIGDVGGVGGVGASGGWLTLPHTKSYYAPCGWEGACALLTTLAVDATALGRAQGIDFTVYDNINFVLSNDLDCCAWGGGFYSAVDNKVYGTTWEPPWGQETGTYSHEMGHSIGLPHSGWIYYAYDSPWDMMSSRSAATNVLCGSYTSANDAAPRNVFCSEPGDGYIAAHKDYLGWIPLANEVVSDSSSSTTVTLEGGSLPLGAGKKILKICITGLPCDGSNAHYFTVEARVKALGATSQYDNAIPGEGVIIHEVRRDASAVFGSCFFNSQSGFAFPVDATPGDYDSGPCNFGSRIYPNFALYNAQWIAGQTYTNVFSVAVVSRSGSNFVVTTTGKAPPTASSVNPNTGSLAGGTNFTITGTNFVAGSVVTLASSAALNVNVVNPTTITATSPSHSAGAVDVVIRNPIGQTATIVSGFTYTNAVPFTDTPLGSNSTAIKKVHITELRARIDALRQQYGGFGFFSYTTDPTITPGLTTIKTQHITEMRAALAPAYSVATGTTATYATDPTLVAGTKVKAAHIEELRAFVLSIE
jgi:M6 family metalloprotease-like protein